VEDFIRDQGLRYADSIPAALGITVGLMVLVVWGAYKVYNDENFGASKNFVLGVLGVVFVVLLVQFPVSYSSAKSYAATSSSRRRGASRSEA
jgi:uncharacterized membrane protein